MRRVLVLAILAITLITITPALVAGASGSADRWIVQLEPGTQLDDVANAARARLGVVPAQRFSRVLNGFAANLTDFQRRSLESDPRVRAIVPDRPVRSTGDPYPVNPNEVQPGIQRVGATVNGQRAAANQTTGGLDVDIAILDTGIQKDNQELEVVGGYNCTDPSRPNSYSDGKSFGHGTHVSGIAAAKENGRGITGVAQGARLWAIKVLSSSGNGYWSWIICGLDRVASMVDNDGTTPTIEVVNMSIAGTGSDDGDCGNSNNDLLHQAICRLNVAGVTMVAAAGNSSRNAANYVPGAYDEVITVSAMADWNGLPDGVSSPPDPGSPPEGCSRNYADDTFAGFSNYGDDVDMIAPGTCVLSTLPVDRLGLMTGTSMATPHVAGGAALYYLAERQAGRGRPSPEQVRAALMARGTLDWRTGTDRDRTLAGSVREPALYVGDFNLDPFFEIGVRRQIVRAAAGSEIENEIWVARVAGFTGPVELDVDGTTLPAGAQADFASRTLSIDLPANAAPGTYQVEVTGRAGGARATATFRLVVFNDTVNASGPVMSVRSGVRTGSVSIPVRVSWPKITNATRYMLSRSVDGGSWSTIGKTSGTGMNLNATPGVRYQFRVRPRIGGVWSSWITGESAVLTVYDPGTSVTLVGSWQHATINDAYSELPVHSSQAGDRATLTFTGRSVGWIGSRGPNRGKADIRVDGVLVSTLDAYAGTKRNRMLLYSRSWSSSGQHTLRIDVRGRPLSRPRIDVDAIVVVSN